MPNWSALPTELKFMVVAHYMGDLFNAAVREKIRLQPDTSWVEGVKLSESKWTTCTDVEGLNVGLAHLIGLSRRCALLCWSCLSR